MTIIEKLTLGLIVLKMSACTGCPVIESGSVVNEQYNLEAFAACASVEGCELDFVRDVPITAAPIEQVRDVCDGQRGCFCRGQGCSGAIFIPTERVRFAGCYADTDNCFKTPAEIALHELVHASFASIGDRTGDHPERFELALQRAQAVRLRVLRF